MKNIKSTFVNQLDISSFIGLFDAVAIIIKLALCLALLSSCTSYIPKPLDPAVQKSAFESRRLNSRDTRQYFESSLGHELTSWPPKSWDITTLTLAAFHFHPDLDMAQARRLLAEAGIVTAGARLNPTVNPSLQHTNDTAVGQSPWSYGAGINIPIRTAGKRDYQIERARHLAQAAQLREAETVWQVRSRVRASLLEAYPTEALVRRQRDLQEEIARLLEHRFAVGYASQPEVTMARLTLNQATLTLKENQKQVAVNLARIAAAVGVPLSALEGISISFESFEHLTPDSTLPPAEVRRQALLARPDVLAALEEYEASQSALQLEIAKQYPDVSLGPGILWDQGAVRWSLGLSLVLPLLNRNEGPIVEAEARRKEIATMFLSAQIKAIGEVEQALAGYSHALEMYDTANTLLSNQQKNQRAISAAYKAGEVDRLAWLSAQYETVAAELARIKVLSQAQQTLGRLEDALRRPISRNTLSATAERSILSKPLRYGDQP